MHVAYLPVKEEELKKNEGQFITYYIWSIKLYNFSDTNLQQACKTCKNSYIILFWKWNFVKLTKNLGAQT